MELLFIYNAGSGLFDYLSDFAHKIISPATYPCSLCALTHGNLGRKERWRDYIRSLPYPKEFLHKDELDKYNLQGIIYPTILLKSESQFQVLADATTLNNLKTLDELIVLLQSKLENIEDAEKNIGLSCQESFRNATNQVIH